MKLKLSRQRSTLPKTQVVDTLKFRISVPNGGVGFKLDTDINEMLYIGYKI